VSVYEKDQKGKEKKKKKKKKKTFTEATSQKLHECHPVSCTGFPIHHC
jgi:hypothetical protein